MAQTKNEIKAAYPLPVYNYRVDIGKDTVGFSEVSGLTIEYERKTYLESSTEPGKPSPKLFVFPGQPTATNITLKKGLVPTKSQPAFYDWINGVGINQVEKKDISISLTNESGNELLVTWNVSNAFPTKLSAPNFDASSNEVAIEELSLLADAVTSKFH